MTSIGICIPTLLQQGKPSPYLPTLLKSLRAAWHHRAPVLKSKDRLTIVIVINGLRPFSRQAAALRSRYQKLVAPEIKLEIIASWANRGFTGAVNDSLLFAQQYFQPDWYIVINDDTQVEPTFFATLVTAARHHSAQVVTCPVLTPNGEIESFGLTYGVTGLAFPHRPSPQNLSQVSPEHHLVCGTCFLVSASVVQRMFKSFGYFFNPLFFAYAEDVEISLRWRLMGVSIYFCSDTKITHFGSQTAQRGSEFQLYHGYRNLLLTLWLTWSSTRLLVLIPWILAGQVYALAMTWYKGHWKVGPKIIKYLWVHREALQFLRRRYATQLAGGYSL